MSKKPPKDDIDEFGLGGDGKEPKSRKLTEFKVGPEIKEKDSVTVVASPLLFRGERLINTGDTTNLFVTGLNPTGPKTGGKKHVTKKRRWPVGFGPTVVPPAMKQTAKSILDPDVKIDAVKEFDPKYIIDNEMTFDTAQPALNLSLQVLPTKPQTWSMTLFGKMNGDDDEEKK